MSDLDQPGGPDGDAPPETQAIVDDLGGPEAVRSFAIDVVEGPAVGMEWRSDGDRCSVGSDPSNEIVIGDPTVSRFHCEIVIDRSREIHVRDLGSKNGTSLDGVRICDGIPRRGSLIRVGRSALRFQLGKTLNRVPLSEASEFGQLVGSSVPARAAFAVLERAAQSNASVLLEGETGTGKEAAARSLHEASARAEGPYVIVDCGAIPGNLLESELFGHERGAFTGATDRRVGAFEEAGGGTIFLDEIGELAVDLQPKLLRVLEQHEIKRVGSNTYHPVDVRVVAATNRDLRSEVNNGRFRSDLYYRLSVIRLRLPALREHLEDIPRLVSHFLDRMDASEDLSKRLQSEEFLRGLQSYAWKGNVRELRNYLDGCIALQEAVPLADRAAVPGGGLRIDLDAPFTEARRAAIDQFEQSYVERMLRRTKGNVSAAARAAGIGRVYLYKLIKRHNLR
jgi:DNA-binding NtrC family response regulator